MSEKRIALWTGIPVEELSRNELLQALQVMADIYEREREQQYAQIIIPLIRLTDG